MVVSVVEKALAMAGQVGCSFVATAGDDGVPHLATARDLCLAANGRVAVAEWFCPHNTDRVI